MENVDSEPRLENVKKSFNIKKTTKMPEKGTDFLSFVEEHENLHKRNKERRLKNKDVSLASTNTGVTNQDLQFSNKLNQGKPNRPFSGDGKHENKSLKSLFKRKLPISRPKTAKLATISKDSEEHKFSIGNPSSNEGEKFQGEGSNRLPDIIENSSNKSSGDLELSSNHYESPKLGKKVSRNESPVISEVHSSAGKRLSHAGVRDESKNRQESLRQIITKSVSSQNYLESSRRNPCEMANEPSGHLYRNSKDETNHKDSVADCTSDLYTQLNLGSPVQVQKYLNKNEKMAQKPKRPSSAGNYLTKQQKNEPLCPSLLSSTIGISRKEVNINLASMLFSKPEVDYKGKLALGRKSFKGSVTHSA